MDRLETLAIWVTAVGMPLTIQKPIAGIVVLVIGAILAECGRIAQLVELAIGDKS